MKRKPRKKKTGPSTTSPAARPVGTDPAKNPTKTLKKVYQALLKSFGPQDWWPGDTRFEIIVGSILTQNTNWTNVEKAIRNLKAAKVLNPQACHRLSHSKLAELIKPSGYFNIKTRRLKNFLSFLMTSYQGQLSSMARTPLPQLREELLSVNGIGPETADSILLYAFDYPSFVIDAYTKRWMVRHRLAEAKDGYHVLQEKFLGLQKDVPLYNEFHALIVNLGKQYCRPKPLCETCPLNSISYDIKSRCVHCFRYNPRGKPCHCGEN